MFLGYSKPYVKVGIVYARDCKGPFPLVFYPIHRDITLLDYGIEFCNIVGADIIYVISDFYIHSYMLMERSMYQFAFKNVLDRFLIFEEYELWKRKNTGHFFSWKFGREGDAKIIPLIEHPVSEVVSIKKDLSYEYYFYLMFSLYQIHQIIRSMLMAEVRYFVFPLRTIFNFYDVFGIDKDGWGGVEHYVDGLWDSFSYFSFGGKTILDGFPMPFVVGGEYIERIGGDFWKDMTTDGEGFLIKQKEFLLIGDEVKVDWAKKYRTFRGMVSLMFENGVKNMKKDYCGLYYDYDGLKSQEFKAVYFVDYLRRNSTK